MPLGLGTSVNLAEYLKVTEAKYEGKSRLAVTKLLCNFLEGKIVESKSVEENATLLLDVKSLFWEKAPRWKTMGRKQLN